MTWTGQDTFIAIIVFLLIVVLPVLVWVVNKYATKKEELPPGYAYGVDDLKKNATPPATPPLFSQAAKAAGDLAASVATAANFSPSDVSAASSKAMEAYDNSIKSGSAVGDASKAAADAGANAAMTSAIATASAMKTSGPYTYQGCWMDDEKRTLVNYNKPKTIKECADIAKARGDPYFGMQYVDNGKTGKYIADCMTGSTPFRLNKLAKNCINPPGDDTYGGSWSNAVYKL
jgi:hypothetical protein